ncbi:MAG: TIGR02594 family protein [Gammaproteobacteria bacterium]|nr:TIGR02594 family protein [Gammaproteobacteria bacterium]
MAELNWISVARQFIGMREVKGVKHNPAIVQMLDEMGKFSNEARAWWRDDETPWCGLFVGYVMGKAGRFVVREWYRAKEWASPLLTKLDAPAYGCIAVLDRSGGGHVGFVVGKDSRGNIMLIGGNQNDEVNISPFAPSRITDYYWPSRWIDGSPMKSVPAAHRYDLPVLSSDGREVSMT